MHVHRPRRLPSSLRHLVQQRPTRPRLHARGRPLLRAHLVRQAPASAMAVVVAAADAVLPRRRCPLVRRDLLVALPWAGMAAFPPASTRRLPTRGPVQCRCTPTTDAHQQLSLPFLSMAVLSAAFLNVGGRGMIQ